MKHLFYIIASITLSAQLLTACGEDRSGEQPFAPTVHTGVATQQGDSVWFTGHVSASPNSSLRECGFNYGNHTLNAKAVADSAATTFTAHTDSLGKGIYYAVAYARNGIGTSYGDTIYFTVQ